jgi:HK97 family phage portal protein
VSGFLAPQGKVLKDGSAERVLERWKDRLKNSAESGNVVVLDADLKFTPVSIPPADAQLLDSRKFGVTEIARLFGVPPHLLGDVDKSTSWGTGIEAQTTGFVVFTDRQWLTLFEQRVTREFLPGGWSAGNWYAEYALEGLLRGDSAARAAFYHQAITDGWMNRNEVRARENLEPQDGLDEFLAPSNLTLISVDGELVPLSAKGTSDAGSDSAS